MRRLPIPSHRFVCAVFVFCFVSLAGYSYGQSQAQSATVQSSTSAQTPQEQAAPAVQRAPAKVWTNDEIDVLHNNHTVSVVGTRANVQKNSATSTIPSKSLAKDAAWYRKQLIPLQAEMDRLDAQIARLQAFLSGENVSDPASLHMKLTPTPQEQLKQMIEKRQADAVKMDDLLDQARHNGIEPGALR